MQYLRNLLDPEWWRFEWRYWRGRTPWDTQETPPEVLAFLKDTPPGRALDLGCGTGTNAITLAKSGWTVTGIDFSPQAIYAARRKASSQIASIEFRIGSAADLSALPGPYDFARDIGCRFNLTPAHRRRYAAGLERLLPAGARYMLYAWLPQQRRGRPWGISEADVEALFENGFHRDNIEYGKDGPGPSAWYWYTRH
jgi:SAM-dependent methyltransferase